MEKSIGTVTAVEDGGDDIVVGEEEEEKDDEEDDGGDGTVEEKCRHCDCANEVGVVVVVVGENGREDHGFVRVVVVGLVVMLCCLVVVVMIGYCDSVPRIPLLGGTRWNGRPNEKKDDEDIV